MKPKSEKGSSIATFLLTCAVVMAWGAGKMFFKFLVKDSSGPSAPHLAHPAKEPPVKPKLPMESLSQQSPGNAPLDHLERTAAAEEGSSAQVTSAVTVQSDEATRNAQANPNPQDEVLKHQSLESAPLPGWNVPKPERLPVPTFAPAIMAMGIVLFAMGVVTAWYVSLVGLGIFAVATWRWVGELQGE